jgi:hypothetical protein
MIKREGVTVARYVNQDIRSICAIGISFIGVHVERVAVSVKLKEPRVVIGPYVSEEQICVANLINVNC